LTIDRIEIVVPKSNGEDVFPPIIGKMDFGYAKGYNDDVELIMIAFIQAFPLQTLGSTPK
jgi:hypothetical protein